MPFQPVEEAHVRGRFGAEEDCLIVGLDVIGIPSVN